MSCSQVVALTSPARPARPVRPARPSRRLAPAGLALAAALACLATLLVRPVAASAATTAETAAATSVLRMLNAERAANHLPALGASVALTSSARRHNLAMAAANQLSHQLPGEPVFTTRISQAGVAWHSAAENVGWTTDRSTAGANGLQAAMYGEKPPNDGHRRNILSTSVRYVGIDVLIDARTGKLWLTEDFADVQGPVGSLAGHNPSGYFDSAVALTNHQVRLRGWAVDPDNRLLSLAIAVYYDGRPLGWFKEPALRPDVALAKSAGRYSGFDITVTLPAGVHSVCTYAINVGLGTGNPKLGCRTVRT
ncbi:CAP domain-containing protein [Jatrophihabitans sp.]|uniref:CAP domain-containing protein n=1 Tax=Jatrophihabitans sp. TaxID=1932789 RepID=UPI002D1DD569|nr:CAP domain-containing protein [Jatrophihabitans sp.]